MVDVKHHEHHKEDPFEVLRVLLTVQLEGLRNDNILILERLSIQEKEQQERDKRYSEEIKALREQLEALKPHPEPKSKITGTKKILNAHSDLLLDIFEISKIEDSEYYRLKYSSGEYFLSVAGASFLENADVCQWPWNATLDQNWKIEQHSSGYYTITNRNSGLLLSIKDDSQTKVIVQQKDSGSLRHQWKIEQ